MNEIEVSNDLIKSNIFIFSKNFLGIPLYVTMKNKHISFEHTHPPHHYILSDDKFKQISTQIDPSAIQWIKDWLKLSYDVEL